jgi:hypothetical protein
LRKYLPVLRPGGARKPYYSTIPSFWCGCFIGQNGSYANFYSRQSPLDRRVLSSERAAGFAAA